METEVKKVKVILYIAMSLDGYIAKSDGSVSWLEKIAGDGEVGYLDFYNTIDTIIMGRKTYDQVLSFGEWGYKGKKTYVLTSDPSYSTGSTEIKFKNENISSLVAELKEESNSNIWLVGGAKTIKSFLEKGLIDEYMIAIAPIILGEGIRLFDANVEELLELVSTTQYDEIIELKYKTKEIKIANFDINKIGGNNEKNNNSFNIDF